MKRHLLPIIGLLVAWTTSSVADEFNPSNPPEPLVTRVVTVAASPTNAGSVSGQGNYQVGKQVTISTTAKTNYQFQYWTLNGYRYNTNKQFSYTVGDSAAHFVAYYQYVEPVEPPFNPNNPPEPKVMQKVTVTSDPLNSCTLSGAGSYNVGQKVTIKVSPYDAYTFVRWTINGYPYASTSTSFTYTVGDSSVIFVAHTALKQQITVSTLPRSAGASYVQIGSTKYTTYTAIQSQKINLGSLSTTPADYAFKYWTLNGVPFSWHQDTTYLVGDSAANFVAEYNYIGTGDTTLFNPNSPPEPLHKHRYTISVTSSDELGTVSGAGQYWYADETVITATPNANCSFVSWQDGDTNPTRTIHVSQDSTFVAYFSSTVPVSYPDNVKNVDCKVPETATNFEMVELYRCYKAHNVATPLVADLDGDGNTEIIAPVASSKYRSAIFIIYDGRDGTPVDSFKVATFSQSGQCVAIADVDNDKKCEIFVLGTDNRMYCYKYQRNMPWQPAYEWRSIVMSERHIPAVADVNNDGIPELVCGRYIFNAQTGKLLLQFTMEDDGMGFGAPCGILETSDYFPYYLSALADIDGDNTLEICAGRWIYKINITNTAGTSGNTAIKLTSAAKTISDYTDYNYDGQTIVLDFDGDGVKDVCVLGNSHTTSDENTPYYIDTYVWNSKTGNIIAHSRTQSNAWDKRGSWSSASIPFAGDIDNNKLPEILFNVYKGGMYAYTYDPTQPSNMRLMHQHKAFAETSGFTVFDFNKDGKNEIVSKTDKKLFIADGQSLELLCSAQSIVAQTMDEYPVIADVNGDGSAEILIAQTDVLSNPNGWLTVYGAKEKGTWASARPVWNQWGYTSVNINQDMTVPQYLFDITTKFPNGKRPFNAFLAQQPIIDQNGDIFIPAADVAITTSSSEVKNDSVEITLSYCNTGDANLLAPYEIAVYQNKYEGTVIQVDTVKEGLAINDCNTITIKVPALAICKAARDTALVIAINDDGHGIAQYGNQQAECDTTNNKARVLLPKGLLRDTTYVTRTISQGESYTFGDKVLTKDTVAVATFVGTAGCDSVCKLTLKVIPYPDNVDEADCITPPMASNFEMKELYRVEGAHSMSTSMVGDIDGDGVTEVLSPKYSDLFLSNGYNVFDGRDGKLKYTISTAIFNVCGQAQALADVDKDGKCELIIQANDKYVYCYGYNGQQRWKSANKLDDVYIPLLFRDKGLDQPLLLFGKYIFNPKNGQLLHTLSLTSYGTGWALPVGKSYSDAYERGYHLGAVADIDSDGDVEYCAGNTIYKLNIQNYSSSTGNSSSILRQAETISQLTEYDGQTFIVDFDNDGDLDICVLANPKTIPQDQPCIYVYVWDGQTDKIVAYSSIITSGHDAVGGTGPSIPYCGDINGDGYPEITFAIKNVSMMSYRYDASATGHMYQLHNYAAFNESCGFTVFDFNQDGQSEIVYRGSDYLSIADGTTLQNLCTPIPAQSSTITEYPIVADVNGDGAAEIVINRAYVNTYGQATGIEGWTSVYGATQPGTWSSARSVWNQWAYNSVNINDDMTVPQYQFNVATKFPNGKRPFNTFLAQQPIINQQGEIFAPAVDVSLTTSSSEVKNDSVEITLSYCNTGDANLLAPYEIAVYQNKHEGTVIQVDTVKEGLAINDCNTITIKVPALAICKAARDTALVIAINDDGHGIAQYGNQQAECDTTNNKARVLLPKGLMRDTTDESLTICDKDLPYTHSSGVLFPVGIKGRVDSTAALFNKNGCDSIVKIHLNVLLSTDSIENATICAGASYLWHSKTYTASTSVTETLTNTVGCDSVCTLNLIVLPMLTGDTSATFCEGDYFTWYEHTCTTAGDYKHTFKSLLIGCDSVVTLHLTELLSSDSIEVASICQGDTYIWHGKAYTTTTTVTETLTNVVGCDSVCTLKLTMNAAPVLNVCNDTIIKAGGTASLWATGADYYRWAPAASVSKEDAQYVDATPSQSTQYTVTGYMKAGDNLVKNGGFENGNTGFTSTYTYYDPPAPDQFEYGKYTIGYWASDLWPRYTQTTKVDFSGYQNSKYMVIDGKDEPNTMFWQQTMTVEPNTDYAISCLVASLFFSNQEGKYALLQFMINGKQVGPIFHSPKQLHQWTEFYSVWNSGNATSATLQIINQNSKQSGNDFGIDNVSFTKLSAGCISEANVNVLIMKRSTDRQSCCENQMPYSWHGKQITTFGQHIDTINSVSGFRDSIVTLQLSKLAATYKVDNASICQGESYTWHGKTYTTTTTVTETLTNVAGCDSICTLNLTVRSKTYGTENVTICQGESYTWHGKTYTKTTTDTYILTNVAGCDSICTLNLTVAAASYKEDNITICEGESYTWHGKTYYTSTTQTITIKNVAGCDSICTLNLTVQHCCPAIAGEVEIPAICADAPTLDILLHLERGETNAYDIRFTNPAKSTMPFVDTTITSPIPANPSDVLLSVAVPHSANKMLYPRPDDAYQLSITAHDFCGNTHSWTNQHFTVFYPSWVIEQHWDDVIAVKNEYYNGGYTFSKIEWMRDGKMMEGETNPYIYLPHDLWINDQHETQHYLYQAVLTRQDDGKAIATCAIEPRHIDNTNVQKEPYVDVTPTLVKRSNPVVHVLTNTVGTYSVFSVTGALIATANYEACEHNAFEITLPCNQNMFMLVFTPKQGTLKERYRVIKVIVE